MSSDRDDGYGRDDRDDRDDQDVVRAARSAVTVPAIGLILIGALGLVVTALNLAQAGSFGAQWEEEVKKIENDPQIPANQKQEQVDMMKKAGDVIEAGLVPYSILLGLLSAVTLLAGVKLMTLSSPGLVKVGAVLSFLPCLSGCCFLGLVFGIWALVVMSRPEVKAGFAARRSPPDSY